MAQSVETRPPLVGRHVELAQGVAALDRLVAGDGQALVLEGEAGVGKTRLLEEFLNEAAGRGMTVLRGVAHELEQNLPFSALADALRLESRSPDPDRAVIGNLLFGHETGGDGEILRLRVVRAVVDLVDRLSRDVPLVLAIEDVHWADPSTLLVLSRLARRLSLVPLGLLLTRRPYPEPVALESVLESFDSSAARRITVAPLGDDDVNTLVRHLVGTDPGAELVRLVAGAGGNPLFVTELVAALREEGGVERARQDARDRDLPPSLRIIILRRLSVLPKPTLDLLRLAAVLGTTFDIGELASLARRPAADVSIALQPALTAAILAGSGPRVAFRHDLIRDAVYADLPEAIRRGLHADAARALTASGRSALHVAPHLLRSATPGEPEVRDRLRQVAREVGPAAHELAVELLGKAIELDRAEGRDDAELVADLARALVASRRMQDAESLARHLLDGQRPGPLVHRVRLILADALLFRYRAGDAIEELEQAFEDPRTSAVERAELAMRIGILWQLKCDLDRSEHWAEQARALGEASGETTAVVGALVMLAASRRYRGYVDEADALARLAEERSPQAMHLYTDVSLYRTAGCAFGDRPDKGIPALVAALRRDEPLGRPVLVHHNALGASHFLAGEWDDAVTEWEVIMRVSEEEASGGRALAACALACIALARDDVATAKAWVVIAEQFLGADDMRPLAIATIEHARGLLADAGGDRPSAIELLVSATRRLANLDHRLFASLVPVDTARVATSSGALPVAEEAARHAAVLAQRSGLAHARATALQCLGLAEGDPALLMEAVAIWRNETSWAPATAAACADNARVLAASGRTPEAISFAYEALDRWEAMGAAREMGRTEELLRSLGVRRGRRGARRRPATGWESLTNTERRVVELVAEGLTYREVADRLFVSRRTVETHVAHVFGKLGVSSRRELVRAWEAR